MQCLNCKKELVKGQIKYCSSQCQADFQYKEYIEKWKNGNESGLKGKNQISNYIKRYLFEKYDNKCQKCRWGEINPVSNKIPLEIHHIDGDYTNNKEENLELLCPNCHSLTPNFKALNKESNRERTTTRKNYCIDCHKPISSMALRCRECECKNRVISIEQLPITREELKKLIRTIPFTKIGEQYGVTDNAIRKWCDKFNLPRKVSEIKLYSDKEWENI